MNLSGEHQYLEMRDYLSDIPELLADCEFTLVKESDSVIFSGRSRNRTDDRMLERARSLGDGPKAGVLKVLATRGCMYSLDCQLLQSPSR